MKLQTLAVIAVIIILPMAVILNSYTSNQIETLDFQISYDSKLQSSTYDAIKSFQLNMSNSSTSDLANSKMRDIKASIKTFYNSLSSNFDMPGYGEEVLKNYVPAVVYTLYDGYYIYSSYENTLDVTRESDTTERESQRDTFATNAIFEDGEKIYGLKPYIYYSCRYRPNNGNDGDFIITYSLDSYVTIQGKIRNNSGGYDYVNEAGYLLTGVSKDSVGFRYNGVIISEENNKAQLSQNVYNPEKISADDSKNLKISYKDEHDNTQEVNVGTIQSYPSRKINGVRYYYDGEKDEVFVIINDKKILQSGISKDTVLKDTNAVIYYEKAYKFGEWFKSYTTLMNLKTTDAVDSNGKPYSGDNNPFQSEGYIFRELDNTTSGKWIEDSDSMFNAHKTEVIKNAIESNLMVAISNYNKVSTSSVNFSMPKLTDNDWVMLTKNISMITFLQGLSIGGKVYNGYAIVQNNINDDFVSENSIYIACEDESNNNKGTYYRVDDPELYNIIWEKESVSVGMINTNFERRTAEAYYKNNMIGEIYKKFYYYPKEEMGSYSSIINLNYKSRLSGDISSYLKKGLKDGSNQQIYSKIANLYYTALGRERWGMYRVNNKYEEIQEVLR